MQYEYTYVTPLYMYIIYKLRKTAEIWHFTKRKFLKNYAENILIMQQLNLQ